METKTKAELLGMVVKGLLGGMELIDKAEKGLADFMAPVVINDKEVDKDISDILEDMETPPAPFETAEVEEANCLKIISESMDDATAELNKQVAELEEAAWTIESLVSRWEEAPYHSKFYDKDTTVWVVVSYIIYS